MSVNKGERSYKRSYRKRKQRRALRWLIAAGLLAVGSYAAYLTERSVPAMKDRPSYDVETMPGYEGDPVTILNKNMPLFSDEDIKDLTGEHYSDLDELGRCGQAAALLDRSMMPTEERGEISEIKPSGWHTVKYPDIIEKEYLYNRCHLVAFALTGQNDNERNLITGTRYMNIEGMLPYEILVERYLDGSDNHVLYRVTPKFYKDELVARGVEMEAYSVEDGGQGVCFHIFAWNVQPGIKIDYASGESEIDESYDDPGKGNVAA